MSERLKFVLLLVVTVAVAIVLGIVLWRGFDLARANALKPKCPAGQALLYIEVDEERVESSTCLQVQAVSP